MLFSGQSVCILQVSFANKSEVIESKISIIVSFDILSLFQYQDCLDIGIKIKSIYRSRKKHIQPLSFSIGKVT